MKYQRFFFFMLLFSPGLLFAQQSSVSIYSGASAEHAGRALDRSIRTTVPLDEFRGSESLDTDKEGLLTPVMVESVVKTALDELLKDNNFVLVENSVLSRESADGGSYGFRWDDYGFEIVFTLEKASENLIKEIEETYSTDAYLEGELRRSYSDNYAVRIFRAENIFNPEEKNIDFREAMISATVIGSTFQPLLGVHDGLGVLDELGLAAAGFTEASDSGLQEYRKVRNEDGELRSFILKIDGMQGDFIDNLYSIVSDICYKEADDGIVMLPEQFLDRKRGDNSDYALFYYDILKRKGYTVKFIIIDTGSPETGLVSTVFFREEGSDLWGRIDDSELEREKSNRWNRMPALVAQASVSFFEPDIEEIFNTGKIILPPPSEWQQSLY